MPQRFDRVHARSAASRKAAKQHANRRRKQQRQQIVGTVERA